MFAGLTLVTPPVSDPVSVADAKAHSRVFIGLEDSVIAGYVSSATELAEDICKRAFMPQTWRYALKHWPGRKPGVGYREASSPQEYYHWNHIHIPKPPLVSIVSFTWTDTAGNVSNMQQGYDNTVGNYLLDLQTEPGKVVLPFSGIWPTTILLPGSPILITFNCGYSAYSGSVDMTLLGVVTPHSGSPLTFDPQLVGTWVTINGYSFNVQTVTDSTHLQVVMPTPAPSFTWPLSAVSFTGNTVPMQIRQAILFLAAHFYDNRLPVTTGRGLVSIEIPTTFDRLLANYRVSVAGMLDAA